MWMAVATISRATSTRSRREGGDVMPAIEGERPVNVKGGSHTV